VVATEEVVGAVDRDPPHSPAVVPLGAGLRTGPAARLVDQLPDLAAVQPDGAPANFEVEGPGARPAVPAVRDLQRIKVPVLERLTAA
jgi:hypothetical protein